MAGITRIRIVGDWTNKRLTMSQALAPTADGIYRQLFNSLNMPLAQGVEIVECTKESAAARYDWHEGIDVVLKFADGYRGTLQEKFLEYWESTMTFTEKQKQKPGAWYTCTAQYYFCGYVVDYRRGRQLDFRDWMLVDFPRLHRVDAARKLPWLYKGNAEKDWEGITFRYLRFNEVPAECVVSRRSNNGL